MCHGPKASIMGCGSLIGSKFYAVYTGAIMVFQLVDCMVFVMDPSNHSHRQQHL